MRLEAGFLHHRDGEVAGGDGVGDGAAGDRPEQAARDDGHLGRSANFLPDRRKRKVDEKTLGSARFEEGAKNDEQDDVGGQHVGHDAEHPVAFVENAGAEFGKGVSGVRYELGCVVTVDTVDQHDTAQDNEDVPHDPPRQFDSQQYARHGDPLIQVGLGADPIVDGLEVPHPVADANGGHGDEQVVSDSAQAGFRPVEEKHEDVRNDDVDSSVVLGRGRSKNSGVRVEDHQDERQDVENPSLYSVQLLEHASFSVVGQRASRPRACRQPWNDAPWSFFAGDTGCSPARVLSAFAFHPHGRVPAPGGPDSE